MIEIRTEPRKNDDDDINISCFVLKMLKIKLNTSCSSRDQFHNVIWYHYWNFDFDFDFDFNNSEPLVTIYELVYKSIRLIIVYFNNNSNNRKMFLILLYILVYAIIIVFIITVLLLLSNSNISPYYKIN